MYAAPLVLGDRESISISVCVCVYIRVCYATALHCVFVRYMLEHSGFEYAQLLKFVGRRRLKPSLCATII